MHAHNLDGLRELAVTIIALAVRDARTARHGRDALHFLHTDSALLTLWTDLAGISIDVLRAQLNREGLTVDATPTGEHQRAPLTKQHAALKADPVAYERYRSYQRDYRARRRQQREAAA